MAELTTPVTAASFQQDVLDASRERPVLVDFWAAWCAPCRALAPVLENVARALGDKVRIVKVDTDAEPELAARFHIRSIPTVMAFRDGQMVSQFVGVQPEAAIREWIEPWLPSGTEQVRAQAAAALAKGDHDGARALLRAALEQAPEDHESRIQLAELEFRAGDSAEAARLLREVPLQKSGDPRLTRLQAWLALDRERVELGEGNSDLDQLYAEGLRAALSGRETAAAESFLSLTERSRVYREDAGRRALLLLFDALGPDHPEVPAWRRRLARLLH